jgi:4-hydroxy-tetrahydrodipicolinate reductase
VAFQNLKANYMSGRTPVILGVAGALGRMGRAIAAQAAERADMKVEVLFDRPDMAGGAVGDARLQTADAALAVCDVIIDFSSAEASAQLAEAAAAAGRPALVIGSTGFSDEQLARIEAASRSVAIVRSGNYSLGVKVLVGLVERGAAALGVEYDLEIFEAHHRRKVDAPSGTALMLGVAAAKGRGVDLEQVAVRVRDGLTGPRPEGAIGFSVLRGGGIIGEHSVTFAAEDEILTLSHSARDRGLFARGALAAAAWIADRPAGLYDMQDILGFRA